MQRSPGSQATVSEAPTYHPCYSSVIITRRITEMYSVYTLSYPEEMGGAVFSVGKGSGNRIFAHERFVRFEDKKRSGNHHKDAVIKRILDAGLEVRKEIVASFDLEIDAFAYEWFLINTVYGLRNLTNMTIGGIGHAFEDSPRLLDVPDGIIADDIAH